VWRRDESSRGCNLLVTLWSHFGESEHLQRSNFVGRASQTRRERSLRLGTDVALV
jgi:hypothetical protein